MNYEAFKRSNRAFQAALTKMAMEWMANTVTSEVSKLPIIAYEKPVFDFITATAACISLFDRNYYYVNGDWQQIIQKEKE